MPVRISQIPAIVSLQSHLTTLMSAPNSEPRGDLAGMQEVVTHLAGGDLTPRALDDLSTLADDARSAVWEHAEASGLLSDAQVAKRSCSMENWYLRQPPAHGDKVGRVLRQTWRAIDLAVGQCETLLP